GRELGQRAEAEQTQERGGRYQERRPPSPVEPRIVSHKTASRKCLDDAAAVGRADVADVGASDWLLVGHDRHDLERRLRQRLRRGLIQKTFDEWPAVWRGGELDLVAGLEQRQSMGWRFSEKR